MTSVAAAVRCGGLPGPARAEPGLPGGRRRPPATQRGNGHCYISEIFFFSNLPRVYKPPGVYKPPAVPSGAAQGAHYPAGKRPAGGGGPGPGDIHWQAVRVRALRLAGPGPGTAGPDRAGPVKPGRGLSTSSSPEVRQ